MRTSFTVKAVVVGLAAGTVVTLAGAGVGYATSGSSATTTVKACANAGGRLALRNAAGHCPRGFAGIVLNKQGPRGATGPAGPGARKLLMRTSSSGGTLLALVQGFAYLGACDVSTSGGTTSAEVILTVAPPKGVSGSLSTVSFGSSGNGQSPVASTFATTSTKSVPFSISTTNGVYRQTLNPLRVVGSNGVVQTASVDIVADSSSSGEPRCVITGSVVPTT